MKSKSAPNIKKEDGDSCLGSVQTKKRKNTTEKKYCVIQCMGYLKFWASVAKSSDESEVDNEACDLSCLVAIGRPLPQFKSPTTSGNAQIPLRQLDFTSRHAMDGKYLFADQRATLILGYLPQELLGTSCYEYCHPDSIKNLADSHRNGM